MTNQPQAIQPNALQGQFEERVDLEKLRNRREALRSANRAPCTIHSYQSDWRAFLRWCDEVGCLPLPASAETVCFYITWLLDDRDLKVSSAARAVCTISHYHRSAGFPVPVTQDVRMVLSAVRRERGEKTQRKAALEIDDLILISECCDVATDRGCRDRAILVFGFASSLRRSELARLQLSDVTFEEKGVAVMIRRSKTDQVGRGRLLGVWAGCRPSTDPVRALKAWILRRGSWAGPLFCRVQTGDRITHFSLGGASINRVVKSAVKRIGRDPAVYGAHSLRAGAVTASAEIGRSDQEIMGLSGHVNANVMRSYVRRARLFTGRDPLGGVL